MIFDTVNTNPCIVPGAGSGPNGSGSGGSGGGSNPNDPRCADAAFAAANPGICGSDAYLVLKPSSSLIPVMTSVQFNTFLYQNGVETQLTTGLVYGSSDPTIFAVGASSGNGTGLAAGSVVIEVTSGGLSASATVTVLSSSVGCSQIKVATAILIDNSNSMSLGFGGPYRTRLVFAQAAAAAYASVISQVNSQPKDSVSVFFFNDTPTQVSTFITDTTLLATQINGVQQSQGNTDLSSALSAAITALQATNASELVILVLSDGEQTDTPTQQDVLNVSSAFLATGGVIMSIGCRASGGFDLLERMSTGGFFINALPNNTVLALSGLSYLKSAVCAGACVPAGDYYAATAELDYSSFINWSVIAGQVNLLGNGFEDFLPGNGLYVELAAANHAATLQSIDTFALTAGDTYEVSLSVGGNNQLYTPAAGQAVRVYLQDVNSGQIIYDHSVTVEWDAPFQPFALSFTAQYAASVKLYIQQVVAAGYTGNFFGNLVDDLQLIDTTTLVVLLNDNFDDEHVTYTPPACGPSAALPAIADPGAVGVQFINYAGGSQVGTETYKYAISYQTQQGQTKLSPVATTTGLPNPASFLFRAVLMGSIAPDPLADPIDRVTAINIWRNDANASSTLYLLATITPESTNFVDTESHAQFLARVNTGIVAPASNTTAVASGNLGTGYGGCYEPVCNPAQALGAQAQDPNPLPDVETGGNTGGTLYTSTMQACVPCAGTTLQVFEDGVGINTTPPYPEGSSALQLGMAPQTVLVTLPAATALIGYNFVGQGGFQPVGFYSWTFSGSNDNSTWTVLDTRTSVQATGNAFLFSNTTPYLYYRFNFTLSPATGVFIADFYLYVVGSGQVCATSKASSYASQAAADAAASAAALVAANGALATACYVSYTATKQYTAYCPCGTYGQAVTISATYTSYISLADANAMALALATSEANNALNCTLSNNTQQIVAQESVPNAPAAPYPTVEYITDGPASIAKVVVNVSGFKTADGGSVGLLLMSPAGTAVILMNNCLGGGEIMGPLSFTIDDAAASGMPHPGQLTDGTSYKPTRNSTTVDFPGCAPLSGAWQNTLAAFIGQNSNGAWALFVRNQTGNVYLTTIASWSLTIT
jgi:hypothetical protein